MNNKTKFYFIILTISLLLFSCSKSEKEIRLAKKGVIDFSEWDFNEDGISNLNGEWEFYWEQLLCPSDFISEEQPAISSYVQVPNLWKKYKIKGKERGSKGYATYKIRILIPEKNCVYSLKFKRVETAYKLWANDEFIAEIGKVGTSITNSSSKWLPQEYTFFTDKDYIDLIIQLSNFRHKKGGITHEVKIGSPKQLNKNSWKVIGSELFIIGALIVMGFYHLGLFFFRNKNLHLLFFGLMLITQALNSAYLGEFVLVRFFPNINWIFVVKIIHITNYIRVFSFSMFIGLTFKNEYKKIFLYLLGGFSILMIFFILFTNTKIFTEVLYIFIISTFFNFIFTITVLFKALRKNRHVLYSLIGVSVLLLAAINDTLYDFMVIETFYAGAIGVFIFILFQSFMLSVRSATINKSIEKLTERLKSLGIIKEKLIAIPSNDLCKTIEVITESIDAQRGIFFINRNIKLNIKSKLYEQDSSKSLWKVHAIDKPPTLLSSNNYLCKEAVKFSEKNKKTFLINKGKRTNTFTESGYFLNNKISSILCSVIVEDNRIKAILYFENRNNRKISDEKRLLLNSINSEISNIIDNANTYKTIEKLNISLEKKVIKRIEIIETQKQKISKKRRELDNKIEEINHTTEIAKSINNNLKKSKIEIEEKNNQLASRYDEIFSQKNSLSKKTEQITASIGYAKRIQIAMRQSVDLFPYKDYFILNLPKEIVSGDFLWFRTYEIDNISYNLITCADCTGHGVPGAFMSMLGISFLNEIFDNRYRYIKNNTLEPDTILKILRKNIIKSLHQKVNLESLKDGMDLAMCIINNKTKELSFAGAYNSCYIIRNNKLIEIKGDRMPIGVHFKETLSPFANKKEQLKPNDTIYLFSDGYADQFGETSNCKYFIKNFKNLLIETSDNPLDKQEEILNKEFNSWKGNLKQTDDVLMIGFKIMNNE